MLLPSQRKFYQREGRVRWDETPEYLEETGIQSISRLRLKVLAFDEA